MLDMIAFMFISTCIGQTALLNSSYYNVSLASGLYVLENNTCNGLVGWSIGIIFFVVIWLVATYYSDIGPGLLASGGVMTMLSLILQTIGINTSGMPILFGGAALLGLIITVLKGVLAPYN